MFLTQDDPKTAPFKGQKEDQEDLKKRFTYRRDYSVSHCPINPCGGTELATQQSLNWKVKDD